MAQSFVSLQHVHVQYAQPIPLWKKLSGRQAEPVSVLRNINLHLSAGSHTVLYGKPASGKSTLLRVFSGVLTPSKGTILINGKDPSTDSRHVAGYVSAEESEGGSEIVRENLHAYATTHQVSGAPEKIAEISNLLDTSQLLDLRIDSLSTTQRIYVNILRALLADAPVLLFDDIADILGLELFQHIVSSVCAGRTIIIATRAIHTAQALNMPILLLHDGTLAHYGTCEDIADNVACPRVVDVWLEGVEYSLLKRLRKHPGVTEVRLLASDQFAGQRLRITLHSSRYLPAMYDVVSQASLIKIEELPPSLADVLARI